MDKERRAGQLNKANEITCSAFLFASLVPLLDNKASIDTQKGGVSVTPMAPGHFSTLLNVMFPSTQ
ncbi:hypothetical protein L345_03034, partial [Ophiophagus hannah]